MPVIIENHSPRDLPDHEEHEYRVLIKREHIAWFKHRRDEGLARCLMRAALAVNKAEKEQEPENLGGFFARIANGVNGGEQEQ